MTLGKRLASLRQSRDLTQTELASLTFISRSRLALYETDKREPDLQTLKILAKFYNVTTDYLLDNDVKPSSNDITKKAYDIYNKLQVVSPENRKAIEILLGIDKEVYSEHNKKAN